MSKREVVKRYKAVQYAFCRDSEKLLKMYADLQTFSYKEFVKVWQDMSFSLVYAGKSSYDEYRHFTEIFIFEAKKYFIFSKNIHLQIGAFYLMYGLYYKQPLKDFVKIRFIKDEFKLVEKFMETMRAEKQQDPIYCYCKMMIEDVFDFVYTQTMLAPELKHFMESFVMCDNTFEKDLDVNIERSLLKLIENKDIIKINQTYNSALSEYIEENKGANLMVFKDSILDNIKSVLDNVNGVAQKVEEDDIGTRRELLKQKAAKF